MVDWVRPNFLGGERDFSNMFVQPIINGMCVDSSPEDVKLSKYRSHVLHKKIRGFVQRRTEAVLTSSLQDKHDVALYVRLSPLQEQM